MQEAAPQTTCSEETIVVFDLAVIINAVYQQNIEPTQAGRVPKRIANKVSQLLKGLPRITYLDDNDYLDMLFVAAQEVGLIQVSSPPLQDIKPRYEPGIQLSKWASIDRVEQVYHLLRLWQKSFNWHDIYGVNYSSWDYYSLDGRNGRTALLKRLATYAPGEWITVDAFLQAFWEEDPLALRPHPAYARQYRNKTEEAHAKWNGCEGEIYTGMLASSLYEFGLVTLGFNDTRVFDDAGVPVNPAAFMLTELGAAALRKFLSGEANASASKAEERPRTLIIQPNFELLLLQTDCPTLYAVLPFTQIQQAGIVSCLTLTRASVLRGIEAGYTVERICDILEQSSQKEIPQNVAYTLKEWGNLYKEAKISQIFLIEVSDEATASRICTSTKLNKFGLRQIAPCMLVMSCDANLQDLRRQLEKEGIIAQVSGNIVTQQSRFKATYGMHQ